MLQDLLDVLFIRIDLFRTAGAIVRVAVIYIHAGIDLIGIVRISRSVVLHGELCHIGCCRDSVLIDALLLQEGDGVGIGIIDLAVEYVVIAALALLYSHVHHTHRILGAGHREVILLQILGISLCELRKEGALCPVCAVSAVITDLPVICDLLYGSLVKAVAYLIDRLFVFLGSYHGIHDLCIHVVGDRDTSGNGTAVLHMVKDGGIPPLGISGSVLIALSVIGYPVLRADQGDIFYCLNIRKPHTAVQEIIGVIDIT